MCETVECTALGTRCAVGWDGEWVGLVDEVEQEVGRRVCGARSGVWNVSPCRLTGVGDSGRCRFHGGLSRGIEIEGNVNGLRHGLYARRLQVCGRHCAAWDGCPLAGGDVSALPGHRRPTCPFELHELSAFLGKENRNPKNRDWDETDKESEESDVGFSLSDSVKAPALRRPPFSFSEEKGACQAGDAEDVHESYELALVRVMMGRAGVAVAHKGLVEETVAEGAGYRMRSSKPSAYLTAYLRIAQEYRRFRRLLGEEERDRGRAAAAAREADEESTGGLADMMLPILEKSGGLWESFEAYKERVLLGEIEPHELDLKAVWYKRAIAELGEIGNEDGE